MKRLAVAALVGLLLAVAPALPAAAAEPVIIDFVVDAGRLTVGNRIRISINLEAEPGTQVALDPSALPPSVELVESPAVHTSEGNDLWRVDISLVLAVFQPGQLDLPPLLLVYTDAAGASGKVETPASLLFVESVLDPSEPPILRDLKPQASFPGPATPVAAYAGLAATSVTLVVVLATIFLLRRRRSLARAATAAPVAAVGPEDVARGKLDEAGEYLRAAAYDDYYARLAVTVRHYLSDRFGFPAFALTTSELQSRMVGHGMDRWQARLVGGLLDQCDAVVYAHYRPAVERADADLTSAYEIIEMSRPGVREGAAAVLEGERT